MCVDVPGPQTTVSDTSCWELVYTACAPPGAVKARAALLGSNKLKAELQATLETIARQVKEFHQVLPY
jgi:hypothetical protein